MDEGQAVSLAGASLLQLEIEESAFTSSPTPFFGGGSLNSLQEEVLSCIESFSKALSEFSPSLSDGLHLRDASLDIPDLFNIFQLVLSNGGFEHTTRVDWLNICADCLYTVEDVSESLIEAYETYLLPFEKYINARPIQDLTDSTTHNPIVEESVQTAPATGFGERILNQKEEIENLIQKYYPGRSAKQFFAFYERQGAMASTRSSLREGLRQAPKINQPFIPDTAPVRQTRSALHTSTPHQGTPSAHTPGFHAAGLDHNIFSADFDIDNFEGKDVKQVPMSTRDVATPGNKPDYYRKKPKDTKQADFYDPYYPLKYLDVPRSDNIYKRVHYGLQSGIPDEVDFALFHLVQMSNQRGDKFRFEGFPLLMETLMEKAMEITLLCTGVAWELERDQYKWPEKKHRPNVLNTLYGTHDILIRIRKLPITLPDDTLETEEFSHHLRNIKEATLVLRNMVLLPENAIFISNFAKGLIRDFLNVMINVPNQPRFNELKNDALDIAEEVTKYMPTAPTDPLCISLYRCLASNDRAHILRALWSITHFSTEIEGVQNAAMVDVTHYYLKILTNYTLIDGDGELLSGTMDYFYQFTLERRNVEYLVQVVNMALEFIPRMIELLFHEKRDTILEQVMQEEKLAPPPSTIPKVPPELFRKLMTLSEPERSSQWLRCCFVEDPDCEITQIQLWQAYQARFGGAQQGGTPQQPNSGALAAADFIKNVSATFTNAQAQVVPTTNPNGQPGTKFIIKGIRSLETPITFDKWPYLYCKWAVGDQPGQLCGRAFAEPRDMRDHVFVDHLEMDTKDQPNQYNLERTKKSPKACRWAGCNRYRTPTTEFEMLVEHVGAHLTQDREPNAQPPSHKRKVLQPRITRDWAYCDTPVNEKGEPIGVAYKAALILRNLLEFLPDDISKDEGIVVNKNAFFNSRREAIITKFDLNRSLRGPLTDVLMMIGR